MHAFENLEGDRLLSAVRPKTVTDDATPHLVQTICLLFPVEMILEPLLERAQHDVDRKQWRTPSRQIHHKRVVGLAFRRKPLSVDTLSEQHHTFCKERTIHLQWGREERGKRVEDGFLIPCPASSKLGKDTVIEDATND